MPETTPKLSARQMALLERVCLKRYIVIFGHYMGSMQPNESVRVEEDGVRLADHTFRPATVESLRSRGLVRLVRQGQGWSHVKPTSEGLESFRAALAQRREAHDA